MLYLKPKHPIFDILSSYTDIEEFYVCGGYVHINEYLFIK